ncbi:MAG: hypothetical protein HOW97_28995 [Catenulispora sp.]|nr:hypothetical protein [Catenulispora sp.]
MNENEIRERLDREIGEEPPVVGGPAAVFAGARARMRRTRVVTGALSMAAVLGVAAGAVAFGGTSGGTRGGTHDADPAGQPTASAGHTSPTTADPTEQPTASGGPTSPTAPPPTPDTLKKTPDIPGTSWPLRTAPAPKPGPGKVLLDGWSTLKLLKDQLPALLTDGSDVGYALRDSSHPEKYGVGPAAVVAVRDSQGRFTSVTAEVHQVSARPYAQETCSSMLGTNRLVTECHEAPQPDGSRVLLMREDLDTQTANGTYEFVADRVFPDGMRITVRADNCDALLGSDKPTAPTRPTPILTMDQLKTIVLDHGWALTVSEEFEQQARNSVPTSYVITPDERAYQE